MNKDTGADEQPASATGLGPVIGSFPEILVLGSFPSRQSLEKGEYYGNPQNQFWKIVEALFGIDHRLPYAERITGLTGAGVALWDMVHACHREGSADTRIRDPVHNDIPGLLAVYPSIRLIALNGRAAEKFWYRQANSPTGVPVVLLPSTSPAHASCRLEDKIRRWDNILTRI